MNQIYFNFYNFRVEIHSQDSSILSLLKKDFSVFYIPNKPISINLECHIHLCPPPFEKIPSQVASMQTNNSICYDNLEYRFCDYYGDALAIDYKDIPKGELFGINKDKIHEISYLYILSKVGKALDLMGLHKLHAFGVEYKDLAIICMMPMKGGKSTLLLEFLKDPDFKMISDDIPLVNVWGDVLAFPIKIGMNHPFEIDDIGKDSINHYKMDRGVYGIKYLLSLEAIPNRVVSLGTSYKKVILINALRQRSSSSSIIKISRLKMFKYLVKHGIIGFGLPMVVEFFWQFGIKDFFIKSYIFVRRLFAFSLLCLKGRNYNLYLGLEPQDAFLKISKLVKNV